MSDAQLVLTGLPGLGRHYGEVMVHMGPDSENVREVQVLQRKGQVLHEGYQNKEKLL